jgi:hypothetical protein
MLLSIKAYSEVICDKREMVISKRPMTCRTPILQTCSIVKVKQFFYLNTKFNQIFYIKGKLVGCTYSIEERKRFCYNFKKCYNANQDKSNHVSSQSYIIIICLIILIVLR